MLSYIFLRTFRSQWEQKPKNKDSYRRERNKNRSVPAYPILDDDLPFIPHDGERDKIFEYGFIEPALMSGHELNSTIRH